MQAAAPKQWQFWIDRGGTFTDVVAKRPDGTLATKKLLSENPERYRDAALQAIREFLELGPRDPIPAERIAAAAGAPYVACATIDDVYPDRPDRG